MCRWTRTLATVGIVLCSLVGATSPASAQDDSGIDLIRRWLEPGPLDLGTAVTDPPISSFGNEPQIPPAPTGLQRVILARLPGGGPVTSSLNDIVSGLGLTCGSTAPFVSCPSASTPGMDLDGPLLVAGGAVDGPLPLGGAPSDSLLELGLEIFDPSTGAVYTPPPEYPNDYLAGLNQCVRVHYFRGAWQPPMVDLFDGQRMTGPPQPFPALTIVTGDRFVFVTPLEPGYERVRLFSFRTLVDNPYAPESVTATIFPSLAAGPFDVGDIPDATSVLDEIDAPPPPSSTTTDTASDDPADAAGEEEASAPTGDDAGDANAWPWIGLTTVGLVVGGLGLKLRKEPTPATELDEPLDAATIEGLQKEFGTPGGVVAYPSASPDVLWQNALGDEHAAQQRVLAAYGDLVAAWAAETGRVRAAMLRYGEAYTRAWQGSDELQQLVRDWEVNRVGAKAADLAVTLATLTIGVGRLGVAGYRGWRAMSLAGKSADELAALARHADDLIDADPLLTDLMQQLTDRQQPGRLIVRQLVHMADEAGVNIKQFIAERADLYQSLNRPMHTQIGNLFSLLGQQLLRARGFQKAAPEVASAVSNVLGNRGAIMRGGALSDEVVRSLRELVDLSRSRPDFYSSLGKMFTEISYGGTKLDDATHAITMLAGAEDIHFLQALEKAFVACGDDLTKLPNYLADALGPAKATALAAGEGVGLSAEGAAIADAAISAGAQTTTAVGGAVMGAPDPKIYGAVGDADAFVLQFGLTGHLGSDAWTWICNPIETTAGWYHGMEGMDLYQELIQEHGDELIELGPAAADAISALRRLLDALRAAGLGDPAGRLGAPLSDLADARNGLQGAAAAGGSSMTPALQERLDHIDRKVATIESAMRALQQVEAALPALIQQLDDMTHDSSGALQGAMEHLDPDLAIALSKLLQLFEGASYLVMGGRAPTETAPLDISPEDQRQLDQVREAHERMMRGEENVEWETPSFDDLPPANDE